MDDLPCTPKCISPTFLGFVLDFTFSFRCILNSRSSISSLFRHGRHHHEDHGATQRPLQLWSCQEAVSGILSWFSSDHTRHKLIKQQTGENPDSGQVSRLFFPISFDMGHFLLDKEWNAKFARRFACRARFLNVSLRTSGKQCSITAQLVSVDLDMLAAVAVLATRMSSSLAAFVTRQKGSRASARTSVETLIVQYVVFVVGTAFLILTTDS